jgi:hypothetical protein
MNEKKYLNMIASMPCVQCGSFPVEIHHLRSGTGMSQRGNNYLTIPLCVSCHRTGKDAIHNNTRDEWKMLAKTIQAVALKIAEK